MKNFITNGPVDIEQTDEGNLFEDDSNEEIVERRKLSALFVVNEWMDDVRDRCFCSLEATKMNKRILSSFSTIELIQMKRVYFD